VSHRLVVSNLSKRYQLGGYRPGVTLRERLLELARLHRPAAEAGAGTIWALRDVDFAIEQGEVVGIIGRNGAGKSTLLKILSRITHPTAGKVTVRGRVASLLEVGVGFHSELTGRENVYLNGSILGMRKREVDQRFDAIVQFAGVEPFIDTQIKHFSSGMRLRLGFAVAAHLEPDVLIVDEVLAVGDAGFQKKCLDAMEGLHGSGRTVLFVSHNMAAVENLCSRAIWIDGGVVRMDGPTKPVIQAYMASFSGSQSAAADLSDTESRLGTGDVRYIRVEYLGADGQPIEVTCSGDPVVLRFHYRAARPVHNPSFGFRLYTGLGTLITETSNLLHGVVFPTLPAGEGYFDVRIESLSLLPARYYLSLWITGADGEPVHDGDARVTLKVEPADVFRSGRLPHSRQGIMFFPQQWTPPVSVAPAPRRSTPQRSLENPALVGDAP
jgi:lipopolysaccharide transport system ATP-binding protein